MKWFDDARYTYNLGIENVKKNGIRSWKTIRNEIVTAKKHYCDTCEIYTGKLKLCGVCKNKTMMKINETFNQDLKGTPKHIRLSSVKNLITNYKENVDRIKNGKISKFKVRFKSRKNLTSDSIDLEYSCTKIYNRYISVYPRKFPKGVSSYISYVKGNNKARKNKILDSIKRNNNEFKDKL